MERSFAFIGGAPDAANLSTQDPKLCVLGVLGGEKPCDAPASPIPLPGPANAPSSGPLPAIVEICRGVTP